jgi:protein phosphatase
MELHQSDATLPPDSDFGLDPTLEFLAPPAVIVIRAAVEKASFDIHEAAAADDNLHGMGTTLTALLYDSGRMYTVHAGDSRAYLFRNNTLEQLTEDHTWIAEQIKSGGMTEEEAKTSKYRHVITRSVGFERTVELDSFGIAVEVGDCFLLCSDGMSNHLSDADIERVLQTTYYRDVPQQLIEMANACGGDDNITVVTVYVANHLDEPESEPNSE